MKSKNMRIAATVAGIALLAVVVLPYLVNVDQLRPRLESTLRSRLGREVHIGYLELSLLAGGARAVNLSVADDPAFGSRPFLHAKSLEIGVSLMSLVFSHTLHLTSLTVEQPELVLAKSSSGKWNFSTLGTKSESEPETFTAEDLDDSPVSSFALDRLKISNATLVLPGSDSGHVLKNVNIDLRNASFDSAMSFVVSARSDAGKIELRGEAGPINRENPERTPFHATIDGAKANLAQIASLSSSAGLSGILGLKGSVISDGNAIHAEGTAHAEKLRLTGSGQGSHQPISLRYITDYSVAQRTGVVEQCEISVRKSSANLTGAYQVRGESLVAQLRLTGSQLPLEDVEGVLPAIGIELPGGSKLRGGTVSANMALSGPVDRLVTSGTVQVTNANLSGLDLGSKVSAVPVLSKMLSGQNLAILSLSSGFRIAPQGTHISNFTSQINGVGGLSGDGDIDATNHLKFDMEAHIAKGGLLEEAKNRIPGMKKLPDNIPFHVLGTTSLPIFVPDQSLIKLGKVIVPAISPEDLAKAAEPQATRQDPKRPAIPYITPVKEPSPVASNSKPENPAHATHPEHKHLHLPNPLHWGRQKNQNDTKNQNEAELTAKK